MKAAPILFLLPFAASVGPSMAQDTLHLQVHGVVVDAASGLPVLEALVEWYDAQGELQAVNQTNNAGKYAFFVRTTGEVELRVSENGYEPFVHLVTVEPGESAHEFTIQLVPK
ncbi:MAG: carboxypeptidase regulatory-like domain-containing protein [Flavobacteriales bacterium]|nr:carboxypeptidase regulatory-like domain-containing protein [Flavobacteriales bacterium]MCB9178606.1 carboxypeptidase regulatory-like domain-containing protein [Flavobacteriales bacterium]